MTKVIHIQYSPDSTGRAALRLHRAFLEAGLESSILSLLPGTTEENGIKYLGKKSVLVGKLDYKIQKFLTRNTNKQFGLFTFPVFGTDITEIDIVKQADVIYLHWVLWGLLNLRNIETLAKTGKPVIFFMHDMWPITGGCHHSFSCLKYKDQCKDCQVFTVKTRWDFALHGFRRKSILYSKYNNLYFVAPSRWLHECAKQSQLTKNNPVFYIPNIINPGLFKPFDKKVAKHILNIDPAHHVIAFGAVGVDSPYKGWSYLKKALDMIHEEPEQINVTVLIFGSGFDANVMNQIPFNVKYVGFIKDELSMSLIYNAADVFVAPSLAEVFGYVILESLCCGTPVVAFNVGGIPDLIKHKGNGYLSKYKDADDLANGIRFCLENNIKGYTLTGLDAKLIINSHTDLIETCLNKSYH